MIIHTVLSGESVYSIAEKYSVAPNLLINDNGLVPPYQLVVGQTLVILYPSLIHIVKSGETLFEIAQNYGTSVVELYRNNYVLGGNSSVYEGQAIVIRYSDEKTRSVITNGYVYPDIEKNVFRENVVYMTYISPFTYGLTEEGDIIELDDREIIGIAKEYGVEALMHLSTLTESGNFSNELASKVLNNYDVWDALKNNILAMIEQKGFSGLDIDFEFVRADDRLRYAELVKFLTDSLNAEGYKVIVALAPKTSRDQKGAAYEGHDYKLLGEAANLAFVMTYEWGYTYGPPQAVSPINGVKRVLDYAITEISPSKILMGMPNYGYDWLLPFERGVTRATLIGNEEAVDIARRNGVEILFDEASMSPYFEYTRDGMNHIVWFEDAKSTKAKLDLINNYNLAGAGYWNLMRPFAQGWQVLNSMYDIIS